MTLPELLTAIPSGLLYRRERYDTARAAALIAFCVERGYRPTLLQIEQERARRATRPVEAPAPTRPKGNTTHA
jgi:hypothetical protein